MKDDTKIIIGVSIFILSVILALYVSAWLMCVSPILTVVNASVITTKMIVVLILKLFFAAPVGRIIIWIGAAICSLLQN